MILTHLLFFKLLTGATGIAGGGTLPGYQRDRIIKLRRQRAFRMW